MNEKLLPFVEKSKEILRQCSNCENWVLVTAGRHCPELETFDEGASGDIIMATPSEFSCSHFKEN